jgi:hypothetical protein
MPEHGKQTSEGRRASPGAAAPRGRPDRRESGAACVLVAVLLVASAGGCAGGSAEGPFSLQSGQYFAVSIQQDGRKVPIRDHTAVLRREPFSIVLAFTRFDGVFVQASFHPHFHDAARSGRDLAAILPFPRTVSWMGPSLLVNDQEYQRWYHFGTGISRFDKVEARAEEGVILCKKVIGRYQESRTGETMPLLDVRRGALYLVFLRARVDPGSRRRVESQREYLKIVFS